MLRRVMGETAFFDALRGYAWHPSHAYKNATTADFQGICETFYGSSLKWFFDEWVYGEGRPRYAYYWKTSASGGETRIDLQVRQTQAEGPFRMPIDVRFATSSGDSTITVWNERRIEYYTFTVSEAIVSVVLDPDGWILKEGVEGRRLDTVTMGIDPNPFNVSADITFEISISGPVEVAVYDVSGARVAKLCAESLPPGYHEVVWDGKNAAGNPVSSGVYFVRLQTAQGALVRKAVLIK
jgi:hypothetical protein